MFALVFMTEFLVVRNYALAIIFITPYTTYLAEAGSFMSYKPDIIVSARITDVIIGSIIGFIGGIFLHSKLCRPKITIIAKKIFKSIN